MGWSLSLSQGLPGQRKQSLLPLPVSQVILLCLLSRASSQSCSRAPPKAPSPQDRGSGAMSALADNAGPVLLALTSQVASHSLCPHGKAVSSPLSRPRGGWPQVAAVTHGTGTWHTGETEYPAWSPSLLHSCQTPWQNRSCTVSQVPGPGSAKHYSNANPTGSFPHTCARLVKGLAWLLFFWASPAA